MNIQMTEQYRKKLGEAIAEKIVDLKKDLELANTSDDKVWASELNAQIESLTWSLQTIIRMK